MEEFSLEKCNNCQETLQPTDKYYHVCGQKNTSGKVSLGDLLKEFISDHLHLDAKLPQTLFALFFRPGYLTNEYFKGKHKTYLKPFRIFAFSAIVFFTIITIQLSKQVSMIDFYDKNRDNEVALQTQDSIYSRFRDSLAVVKQQVKPSLHPVLDSTFAPFTQNLDSLTKDTLRFGVFNLGFTQTEEIKIAKNDFYTLTDKEIVNKYNPENFLEKLVMKQNLRILRDSAGFARQTTGYTSWMFFIMIPFFAMLLKLVYIRKKMYYVEHLIFTFHIHSFFFIAFSLSILFEMLVPSASVVSDLVVILGMVLYIFIAMKRFYQHSFWLTLVKSIFLFFGYFFIFTLFFVATFLLSLVLF